MAFPFPLTVLRDMVRPPPFEMPFTLWRSALRETVSLPRWLRMAGDPRRIETPLTLTETGEAPGARGEEKMLKIGNRLCEPRWAPATSSLRAPGPLIARSVVRSGSEPWRAIVPVALMGIRSKPGCEFARSIARRSEPGPESWVFVTLIVAAPAVP